MNFICERINVSLSEDGFPLEFVWKGVSRKIVKVERGWQEYGLPKSGSPKSQTWLLRRHRNYFRVRTEEERRFHIYMDRGSRGFRREWILEQELVD